MPRVSVLLPAYNGMPDLPRGVESILTQTFGDWELIIIDDASTDSTSEYLASLCDRRIRVLRNLGNQGIARSLNRGVRESSGVYIARQDADDYSYPSRIEKQVAYLDAHPRVAVLATNFYIVASGLRRGPAQRVFADLDIRLELLFENVIAHTSVMMRRSAVLAAGGYPESCRLEDYELWLRIAEFGQFGCLPEPLVRWTRRPDSYTNSDPLRSQREMKLASERGLTRLLGGSFPREPYEDFLALYRGGGRKLPLMSLDRVKAATSFAAHLQAAFYGRAACDRWAARRHCARVRARWAGHLARLAIQEVRDLPWRAGVMANALRLLTLRSKGPAPTSLAAGVAP